MPFSDQPLRPQKGKLLGRKVARVFEVLGEADAAADGAGEGDLPVEAAGGQHTGPVDQRHGLCLTALRRGIPVEPT